MRHCVCFANCVNICTQRTDGTGLAPTLYTGVACLVRLLRLCSWQFRMGG